MDRFVVLCRWEIVGSELCVVCVVVRGARVRKEEVEVWRLVIPNAEALSKVEDVASRRASAPACIRILNWVIL